MCKSSIMLNKNVGFHCGFDGHKAVLLSSDILHVNATFQSYTVLRESLIFHYTAKINDTHFLITGNEFGSRKQGLVVDPSVELFEFSCPPPMLFEREDDACVTIIQGDDVKLIAVGDGPSYTVGNSSTSITCMGKVT